MSENTGEAPSAASNEPVVGLLADEWAAIGDLVAPLDEDQFATPTDLPGWTVKDCLSHVVGTELMMLGEKPPAVDVSHLAHVREPFQQTIEVWVEARRDSSGASVRDELESVAARRLDQLRAMGTDDFDKIGWSPIGEVPYRDFMVVRVFDCWMHEQDMRRALGIRGHLAGPVVDMSLTRFSHALGVIVGKRAAAPDGSSVVFVTDGEPERTFPVVVDGRASLVEAVPDNPTVVLRMPFETFVALGGGRFDASRALASGGVTIEGDGDLANRVLASMAFTP